MSFSITSAIKTAGNYGSQIASQINPMNWSRETQTQASKVAAVACIAFVGLSALERIPVALAAKTSQFIYDCGLSGTANAVKASAIVLAETWDPVKAQDAYKFITNVGKMVDELPSNYYLTRACQAIANNMPYNY